MKVKNFLRASRGRIGATRLYAPTSPNTKLLPTPLHSIGTPPPFNIPRSAPAACRPTLPLTPQSRRMLDNFPPGCPPSKKSYVRPCNYWMSTLTESTHFIMTCSFKIETMNSHGKVIKLCKIIQIVQKWKHKVCTHTQLLTLFPLCTGTIQRSKTIVIGTSSVR